MTTVRVEGASRANLLAALPGCACFLFHAAAQHDVLVDDAWIFHRYAANWAAGLGLVFNAGERVEGYSSLLWTTMLALGARLAVRPEVLAPLLGLCFGCLTLILASAMTRRLVPRSAWLPVVTPIAVSLSTGLAYFAVAGMDTPLFACVLLAAAWSAVRWTEGGRTLPLVLGLTALIVVRAEGLAYVAALLAVLRVAVRGDDARVRAHRLLVAWAVVVAALQFGGRWMYYGEWVPAPALSKAILEHAVRETARLHLPLSALVLPILRRGVDYQRHVLVALLVPAAALVVARARGLRAPVAAWISMSLVVTNALLIVLAAGDWMPYQRMGIPVWPFVLLLAGWTCVQAAEWCGLTVTSGRTIAAMVMIVAGAFRFETAPLQPRLANIVAPAEHGGSLLYRQMGELLAKSDRPVTVVTNIAGKMPYYAGPRTRAIDLMGLTDRWNATHGDRWSLWFGRTDYAGTFRRPFDLFVTSSTVDLVELANASAARADGEPAFLFFPARPWLDSMFYVAADRRHPIAGVVTRFCRCSPEPLTVEIATGVRSGGFGATSLR